MTREKLVILSDGELLGIWQNIAPYQSGYQAFKTAYKESMKRTKKLLKGDVE